MAGLGTRREIALNMWEILPAAKPYRDWLKVGFRKLEFGKTNGRRRSPSHAGTPTEHRGNGGPFGFDAPRGFSNVHLVL